MQLFLALLAVLVAAVLSGRAAAPANGAQPVLAPVARIPVVARGAGLGWGDVAVGRNFFEPWTLEVGAGRAVVWANRDGFHTVTADATGPSGAPLFDSGSLRPGQEFSFVFAEPGVYPYHCRFHGAPGGVGHAGTVVVRAEA